MNAYQLLHNMKSTALALLALTAFTALSTARAQFTFVESGGTFRPDATNIAAASNGATAIGQDELGYDIHFIGNINDSTYGNASSWIGFPDFGATSWVGVIFSEASTVASFAFGRDNNGVELSRVDYAPYSIQYTTDVLTDQASADSATWTEIGTFNYSDIPAPVLGLRNLYNLDIELTDVTGFRIVTTGGISNGNAIDELEIYTTSASAVPEPATFAALFGVCALGVAAIRRRRR